MTITLYKNSFITTEDANAYFDERYDSEIWTELEEDKKEKLLITASKKISAFEFVGAPKSAGQPMAFPRDFELPQDIKDAVCEEAITILEKAGDVHQINQDSNISSISLGAGSVSYGKKSASEESKMLVSCTALFLVKKWVRKGFNSPC